MDDFEIELKTGFLDEASSALAEIEQCFLDLEQDPKNSRNLDQIFRLAHNLKGSSKAVGFDDMGAFTHEFESLLLKIKNGDIAPSPEVISLLLRCGDHLNRMVAGLRGNFEFSIDSSELLNQIDKARSGTLSSNGNIPSTDEEVTISLSEIQALQAVEGSAPPIHSHPENLNPKMPENLETADESEGYGSDGFTKSNLKELRKGSPAGGGSQSSGAGSGASASDESIRVSLKKLEKLMNYVGEMTILHAVLREQAQNEVSLSMKKTVHQLAKVGKEIQDISLGLRMVPIKPVFQKMQRIVRDTARALNKDVNLILSGEETELDKTVLELVNDPLVHLIRNSVDHGIESIEKRKAAGKIAAGQVYLSARHEAGKIVVEVKDDGGGIDPQSVRRKAIEKGLIRSDLVLTDKECLNLIFLPGFSTKEVVTDVSGRGVGMDVVRTNVEELGGEIQLESSVGEGSTFRILLPLTMAIIDGMIVRVGTERFVVPLVHVHESLSPGPEQIRSTAGIGDVLLLRGENLPVFRLSTLFGRKSNSSLENMIAIVVRSGQQPFALLVDDIIGQYQVVIKQLGPDLQHLKGVSGSTILGDGRPALIVEPVELVKRDLKSLPKEKELRRLA